MDINIGAALWLAVRAVGRLHTPPPPRLGDGSCAATTTAGPARAPGPDSDPLGGHKPSAAPVGASSAHVADADGTEYGRRADSGACMHDRAPEAATHAKAPPSVGCTGSGCAQERAGGAGGGTAAVAAAASGGDDSDVVSQARVVLLGHGADEVFGGYGRHRTRFREAGWGGLQVLRPLAAC